MTAPIAHELGRLTPSATVQLFVLDATALGAPGVLRFAPQVNVLGQSIRWQGLVYEPFPIEASGFEQRAGGAFPRPTLRCANVLGTLGAMLRQYRGLKGARITRKRTLARYLDAANFPGGVNAEADPTAEFPDEVWLVDRTARRNRLEIEFELANPLDVAGVMLPGRAVYPNHCPWRYRGDGCGYAGPPVARADDAPTVVAGQDQCGKRLASCRLRFGNGELPFGGFPGVGLLREV
jgi:lambda family phage minor tail protein L